MPTDDELGLALDEVLAFDGCPSRATWSLTAGRCYFWYHLPEVTDGVELRWRLKGTRRWRVHSQAVQVRTGGAQPSPAPSTFTLTPSPLTPHLSPLTSHPFTPSPLDPHPHPHPSMHACTCVQVLPGGWWRTGEWEHDIT